MKNLFTSVILLIIASALFQSCSRVSNTFVTKRHYRNGYYIDDHIMPVEAKAREAKTSVDKKTNEPSQVAVQTPSPGNEAHVIAKSKDVTNSKLQTLKRKIHSIERLAPIISIDAENDKTDSRKLTENKNFLSEKNFSYRSNGGNHNLLRLLLIIILIVLIISFFSNGFGIGYLLYLILVVLLIVLLLKVLGVF